MIARHFSKCLLGLALIVCATRELKAQQAKQGCRDIQLNFDESGRLLSFPPTIVRARKKICLKLAVPKTYVLKEVSQFRSMLIATYKKLNDKKNYTTYHCYFEDSDFDLDTYLDDLKNTIDALDSSNILVPDPSGLIASVNNPDFIPIKSFVANLLQYQFWIKVSRGPMLGKPIYLNKVSYDANFQCFYFTADCKTVKDLSCAGCGVRDNDALTLNLMSTDPFNLTLKQWFETQNEALDSLNLETISDALNTMAANDIDNDDFLTAHGNTKDLKDWYPVWFWYTGGNLVLDPFNTPASSVAANLKDKIKSYADAIDSLQQQKSFADSTLKKLRFVVRQFPVFGFVQAISLRLGREIQSFSDLKTKAEKQLSGLSDASPDIQPTSYLNKVSVFLTDKRHVRPQLQLDAAQGYIYTADTRRQYHRAIELPENERPVIIVHNVDSSAPIKFDNDKLGRFSDDEDFTTLVFNFFSGIDSAKVAENLVKTAQDAFASFIQSSSLKGLTDAQKTKLKEHACNDNSKRPLLARVKQLSEDYANNLFTLHYAKSIFTSTDPDKPIYSSESKTVKVKNAPFLDTIPIKETKAGKETQVEQPILKVGGLSYFSIVSGIAVTDRNATVTTIDTSGGGFRVGSTDNKARLILGFKLYPFQYYKRDRWLIPRYPLHRFSIFGGFEMLHPLNNFYVGGCYDVVPGLGFSMGANFYLQTQYKVENNVIVDTHRSYTSSGKYYSIVVNPLILASFVKYFFKAL